ncbi:MAG: N-acetylmuramoyl-L-alanine amidase [Syntrophomonadaceae bacterium]
MIYIEATNLTFGLLFPRSETRRIIIHHSASPDVPAGTIHGWHLQKGWSGIGYHFVVRLAGIIEAGRPLEMVGAHAGPEVNRDSIGICLTGNFMDHSPTGAQLLSLVQLIDYLRNTYQTNLEVLRHKDVAYTDCPGNFFAWPEKNWPLFAPTRAENEAGNTLEPWKNELMRRAAGKKLITQEHDPDETAPKWFVLAVGLNILQEVWKHGQDESKEDGCPAV